MDMKIHQDARDGALTKRNIAKYLDAHGPYILGQLDDEGLTPLAAAAVAGYADEVEFLLASGAKADALSRDGRTALLLVATNTRIDRLRIIQLLLASMPSSTVDATSPASQNNTPLMAAVQNKDVEAVRLLRRAGASTTTRNSDGATAMDLARQAGDQSNAMVQALDPEKEQIFLDQWGVWSLRFLLYTVAWSNASNDGAVRRLYNLGPALDEQLDEDVNDGEDPEDVQASQFFENVRKYLQKNPTLPRFFGDNENYIQNLAQTVGGMTFDAAAPAFNTTERSKKIKLALHQHVICCDDSSSMKRENRWETQKQLVKRMAQITTRMLPEGDGIELRFINQEVDDTSKLTLEGIYGTMESVSWKPGADSAIGRYLKASILEPRVYAKLRAKTFERPLLVTMITDGMPEGEVDSAFANAVVDCGNRLEDAGYPRNSVKFMACQVGTSRKAAEFLESLRIHPKIDGAVYCTTNQLDDKFSKLRENEANMDRWLIETLFSPFMGR